MRTTVQALDVLLPHYNDLEGLKLTLQSVAAQTWRGPTRIVICDDGSNEVTAKQILNMCDDACEGSHLTYYFTQNSENRGRPYTRNVLLDAVNSQYVAWIDSGDEWYENKIALQLSRVYDRSVDGDTPFWVTCDYDWQWNRSKRSKREQKVGDNPIKLLLIGNHLRAYLWTILAPATHMKSVGWFDEKLPRLQDLDFFLRFAIAGGQFIKPRDAGPLCVYHKSDVGRDAAQIRDCNYYILDKYFPVVESLGSRFMLNRKFGAERLAARVALNNGAYLSAFSYNLRAATHNPTLFIKELIK